MKAKASAKLLVTVEYNQSEVEVLLEAIPLVVKKSKLDEDKKQVLSGIYNGLYDAVFPAKGRKKREVEENEFDEDDEEETPARVSDDDEDDEDIAGLYVPTTWRELKEMSNEDAQQLAEDLALDNVSRQGIANHLGIEIPVARKKIKPPVYVDPRTKLREKPGKFVKRSFSNKPRDI